MSLPLAEPLMGTSPASEFQNYLFFLYHFRQLIWRQRGDTKLGVLKCLMAEQSPRFAHVVPRQLNGKDHAAIRKYLFTAWNAEVVSRLPAGFDPEVLQFTNQWKPVQAYYAVYFHLVTLHFAVNAIGPKRHEPTLRYATQTILPWFPQPWCLRFHHTTETLDEFPAGTKVRAPSGWNVSRTTESNTYVACFFRTTAERDQKEKYRQYYKGKRKRIEAGPRAGKIYTTADVKVDPVSFFNVLWRFRRWANYLDADTIIEGGDFTPHAVEFDRSFNEIVETTALTCEHILKHYIGSDRLRDLYKEYLALVGGHLDCATVERRLSTLCSQC